LNRRRTWPGGFRHYNDPKMKWLAGSLAGCAVSMPPFRLRLTRRGQINADLLSFLRRNIEV